MHLIKLEKLDESVLKNRKVCAVIGFFDGVHLGHKKIITRCTERAEQKKGVSVAFTFDKPPVNIIKGRLDKKLITSYSDKIKLLALTGVDYIVVARFDSGFANLEPEKFCSEILEKKLHIKELFIGEGFRFGKDSAGDIDFLRNYFSRDDVKINEVDIFRIDEIPVSSTEIRKFYSRGDIENVTRFLGRIPSIKGTVVSGDRRGRLVGFPTANIDVFEKYVTPADGVYAGYVHIFYSRRDSQSGDTDKATDEAHRLPAVINIGNNPTFSGKRKWVESHIIEFNENIYGKKIEVFFVAKLRNEITFTGKSELVEQVRADIERAKNYFKKPVLE
ncbi:MAG: bifunctional riboflavin kinase/FAD synthetase [Actinobacteria bacterium]|nr:bifunctional riboflavin kinase/FAD synthetase [Actinomycetota bacterium]